MEDNEFTIPYENCINRKGGAAILIDNYIFNYHSYNEDEGSEHWRCANRPCKVSATTRDGLARLNGKEHMDDVLTDIDIKMMRKLQQLREQAMYTDTAIPKLYARAIGELNADGVDSEYLALFFPKLTSIQKTLYKFRNLNTPAPVDDTDDIVLDGEYILCQDEVEVVVVDVVVVEAEEELHAQFNQMK
ncbi:unnamed protein product, partial [Brachionus calyciflorus]